MKFVVKDCDPSTGEPDCDEGYEDDYNLEDMELTVADYVQRTMKANFAAAWEELGPANELEDTYQLSNMKTLEEALNKFLNILDYKHVSVQIKWQKEKVLMLYSWPESFGVAMK